MSATLEHEAVLLADAAVVRRAYDIEPFGYTHTLSGLDLLSLDAICKQSEKHAPADYFVAGSAASPGTPFYDVPHGEVTPLQALQNLESRPTRVLLKRPERYSPAYRDLLESLYEQVVALRGVITPRERLRRLDASILVSSAATTTPFHFDPEISFFFQIEGAKSYHMYAPGTLGEDELEAFYIKDILNIGQVPFEGRPAAKRYTFELGPGKGMHQPRNSPHWVQTQNELSISYVFSIETDATRAEGRTRGFNYFERKLGLTPAQPGQRPQLDAMKAGVMRAAFGAREAARSAREAVRRVGAK
jgi:hypothetical protein